MDGQRQHHTGARRVVKTAANRGYSQRMASAEPIFAARRAGNQHAANTVANRMTTIAR
jgi:hypothetical protein